MKPHTEAWKEVTWQRKCSRCQHAWVARRLFCFSGVASHRQAEKALVGKIAKFRQSGRELEVGITCPNCERFTPDAVSRHFEQGFCTWIADRYRPDLARRAKRVAVLFFAVLAVGWLISMPFQDPRFVWRRTLGVGSIIVLSFILGGLGRLVMSRRQKTLDQFAPDLVNRILSLAESDAEKFLARVSLSAPQRFGEERSFANVRGETTSRDDGDDLMRTDAFMKRILNRPLSLNKNWLRRLNTMLAASTVTPPAPDEAQHRLDQFLQSLSEN